MTDNIKLPPFPDGLCLREDIEDYAREAVRLNVKGVPDERKAFDQWWASVPIHRPLAHLDAWVAWQARAAISSSPAAPQPAQPLTDAEIKRIATYAPEGISDDDVADIVRRVERMHGIGA